MTKQETFIDDIAKLYANGIKTIQVKNADYANDINPFKNFETTARVVGITTAQSIMTRLCDKITRTGNLLTKDAAVLDEKIEDTIMDGINYFGILYAWLLEEKRRASSMKFGYSTSTADSKITDISDQSSRQLPPVGTDA